MPTRDRDLSGLRRVVSDLSRRVRARDRAAGIRPQQIQQQGSSSSIVWVDPIVTVFTATGTTTGGALGPWESINFNTVPPGATSILIDVIMSFTTIVNDIQLGMEYRTSTVGQSYLLADQQTGQDSATAAVHSMAVTAEIPPPVGQSQVRFRRDGTTYTYTIKLRGYRT